MTRVQRDGFSSLGWKSGRMGAHRPWVVPLLFHPRTLSPSPSPPSPLPPPLCREKPLLSPRFANDGCTFTIVFTLLERGQGWGYDKFPVYKLISGSVNPPPSSRPPRGRAATHFRELCSHRLLLLLPPPSSSPTPSRAAQQHPLRSVNLTAS